MVSPRKQEIIDTARGIVYRKGYSAFSYQDLSSAVGITKASIHGHVGPKENLGCSLIELSHREMSDYLLQALEGPDTPRAILEHMIDSHEHKGTREETCLSMVLQNEYRLLPPSMQERLDALNEAYLDGVAAILARGRELGEFQFDEAPRDKALFLLATLHGAVLKFRSVAPGSFDTIRGQLLATLS